MKKRIILRTSDAWSTSHLSQQTSKAAYYIVDCQILCIDSFIKRNVNANSKRLWPYCGMHDEAVCSGDVSCQNLLLHVLSNVN